MHLFHVLRIVLIFFAFYIVLGSQAALQHCCCMPRSDASIPYYSAPPYVTSLHCTAIFRVIQVCHAVCISSQHSLPPVVYSFHCSGREQKDLTFLRVSREVTK